MPQEEEDDGDTIISNVPVGSRFGAGHKPSSSHEETASSEESSSSHEQEPS
jgi:hypothetical protein